MNSSSVKLERRENSKTLLVSFAAIKGPAEAPAFAFGDVARNLQATKLFFVDPHEVSYQMGIPDVGTDFWEIAEYIKDIQKQEGPQHTIVIGNSSGGFAAMVVGTILGADMIHVFNPTTLLSSEDLVHNKGLFRRLQQIEGRNRSTYDLADFLRREMLPATKAFVYCSDRNEIDGRRNLLLKDVTGVRLVGYPYPEHDLARYLARQGTITRILEASLEDSTDKLDSIISKSQTRARIEFIPNMTRRAYAKLRNRISRPWKSALKKSSV